MTKLPKKRKRRGVILSDWGLQRFQNTQEQLAIAENGGFAYTLERLSNLTGLSARSIGRLRSCKAAVDRQTLEDLFCAFNLTLTEQDYIQPEPEAPQREPVKSIAQNWGEAIDVSRFYGRTAELTTLTQWILQDNCRLVGILGIGGIGKTALSVKLAEGVQNQFTYVIWRSLRNAPPLATLLAELVPFLSGNQDIKADVSSLLQCLRNHRCLVVLDNMETLLQTGNQTGYYRPGYEAYGELIEVLAETRHQSCFVLTSREKPAQIAQFEGVELAVRTLPLNGSPEAATALIEATRLTGSELEKQELCDRYRCNPLALKIVATSIRDLFDGEIGLFLQQETLVFNGLCRLLDHQFDRLSRLETIVMYWLAINREWTSITQLQDDIIPTVSNAQLLEALEGLTWRSLVEKQSGFYTQQPVVMEYVTDRLIEGMIAELKTQELDLFVSLATLKTTVKDYIRESQSRLILQPIASELQAIFGSALAFEQHIQTILKLLQQSTIGLSGYAAGNLLNLCIYLHIDLTNYDFSGLAIAHAYLQQAPLHQINFADTKFKHTVFKQTFGSIFSVAFSPDRQFVAAGEASGEIRLWRVRDGQPILTLNGHTNWVWTITFSPDSKILASGGRDCCIKLWNVESGQLLNTLQEHSGPVLAVRFSPDGTMLASASADTTVKIWDIQSGKVLTILEEKHPHSNWVRSIAWSPNGSAIASGSEDCTVKLWDIQTGRLLQTLTGHTHWVRSIDWSQDGTMLVSGSNDHSINLWDRQTGQILKTLRGHSNGVAAVQFCPIGAISSSAPYLLASSSDDQTIKLWDIQTGQLLRTLQGHVHWVWSIAWNPDGTSLVSGSFDRTLKLWDIETGQPLKTLQGYANWVWSIAWNRDGTSLASGSDDHTVKIWDVDTGQLLKTLADYGGTVSCVAWSSDGFSLASASSDRTVKIWDAQTGQRLKTFQGHTNFVWCVAWSPDDTTLISGSEDHTVKLWNTQTGQILSAFGEDPATVWAATFSPDGTTIANSSVDNHVNLWDVNAGKKLRTLQDHRDSVLSIAWHPDGSAIASGSADTTVKLWNSQTGQLLKTLEEHTNGVWSVAFSPDGSQLASGSYDRTIKLWDAETGELLNTLQGHTHWVLSVAFSPKQPLLASSSVDGSIKIWDIRTGECLKTLRADRPYEGMNITRVMGITEAQKATLEALGAIGDQSNKMS
jgi:WD40 repeat protein